MNPKTTDSWKNQDIFQYQLLLNLQEFNNYPKHWKDFLYLFSLCKENIGDILDIGCGCGAYYELCKREIPNVVYTGIDYSDEAINTAINYWKYKEFYVKDFWKLTTDYIQSFDLIHCGALFDIFPNGDEAIKQLLSLKPHKLIIGRIKITPKHSYYTEYLAYGIVPTYAYYHNIDTLNDLFTYYNYSIIFKNNSILLEYKRS